MLYGSFIENISLVKIQKNVNQRKHIHKAFGQKFLTQLKWRILTIKIGVTVLYKNLFFFARLNRFLYSWVFKCQIPPGRF